MSTLSKDDQEALRLLVQYVARAFYEPKFTIVLDQLVRHPVLKDDDLAGRMGLQLKELNKVMAVLENDKLVRIYRQNELKEGAQRSVGRQYYYIDYQHFCNVVKWRVAEMHRRIDNTLRNELGNKGYICPQCGKAFSPLEADKVIDFMAGTFNCDVCRAELVDNDNAESVRGSKDRMQRFNRQMRFILEGLRKTEEMVLPAFDVAMWIKMNIIDVERAKAAAQSGGLKIAGEGGGLKHEDSIGIVLSVDKDEATQRMERDKEAAAKRQQNILPAWHLKSTISGDLTALGIRENALRAQEVANGEAAVVDKLPSTSSNDVILRGLSDGHGENGDVKPDVTRIDEVDYFEQYYASLAASAAPSTQDTPAVPDLGSEFGEEEDVKPSVEYLDSLNAFRKRSRSTEDVGFGGGQSKIPRTANGTPETNGAPLGPDVEMSHAEVAVEVTAPAGDDPLVNVNGTPVPLSQITEEHQELMTPEEYTAYYEIMSAQS
ncbi:TFIIE alpha subunit-domain-containing protein [Cristinia sonorae]|uniref:TFIIE alpha subunit-domain-containing protein n=1 Tax=Cristinia sonorae TaxID=1940300 RepID=A0A8K0XKJ0_9AGAR|nr:TFIIE alpha subunit-domain-containing protein [Cristinia sonorae]